METPVRVLHVDDDPQFAELTATALERNHERFSVETVTDPSDCLDRLSSDVDCLVSDYEMPGTDGIELLRTVREDYPDLPFVLFTGKGSEEVASEAISAGVTDYLQKRPGTEQFALLANRIENAVEQARARRRAAEHRRVSTVIRDIDKALVRATGREEIGRRVCEILADAEPYVFAWIGDVDPATDRIDPQAAAGVGEGYLDEITVTADESPTGQGPGGTALREDRIVVSQNIGEDETFAPWRGKALERGYRAVAAIPLSYSDTRYGLLAVYSNRPYAFDESERSLLSELGDTVAHAYHRVDLKREFEDQYRDLFEEAPVMFALTRPVDGEPVIDDCNERFAAKLGYDRDQLRDRPLSDVYTEESARELLREGGYERALTGDFIRERRNFRARSGDVVETLLRATPRRDTDGEVVGTHALYVDVTDRDRLESLEALRERMEFALEATDSVLFELDLDLGRETRHGPFERLYGVPSERVGTAEEFYEQCVHPEDRDRVRRLQRRETLVDAGGTVDYEFRTHPDRGERRWIQSEMYVVEDATGEPERVVGLNTDVTERTERERELQRQHDLFREAQDLAEIGAWEWYPEDGEGYYSEQVYEIYGIDTRDGRSPGADFEEFYHHEDRDRVREAFERAIESGEPYDLEVRVVDADGDQKWVRTRGDPQFEDGDCVRVRGTIQNVTERKERERQLARTNDRLDAFASVVSHDLRNPLQVASGRLELLAEEHDSDHLDPLENALDRMEQLIDDLLRLAREGDAVEDVETVDLPEVFGGCWRTVETADATLAVETDAAIRADPDRLKQLVENLLRNAIEHGGRDVTVTVGDLDDRPGFYVADDGPGIPEDDRERVFTGGYSTATGGTGFGLAIVEEIADAHGWTVDATEAESGGARFEIAGVETAT